MQLRCLSYSIYYFKINKQRTPTARERGYHRMRTKLEHLGEIIHRYKCADTATEHNEGQSLARDKRRGF